MPFDCSGQPAAALAARDLDLEAVVLEQLDGHLPSRGSYQFAPQPWKYATRRAAGGDVCLRAQPWNVRPANSGSGASRWPDGLLDRARSGLVRSE